MSGYPWNGLWVSEGPDHVRAEIERLTAELQHARNLFGNASGALADYTNLPTDTKPADAIRILADKVWEEQP